MADLMWTAVKEPGDGPVIFDKEGLTLAYKFFTSSTLTLRLAGIAQMNVSSVNLLNCLKIIIIEVMHKHGLVSAFQKILEFLNMEKSKKTL